MFRAVGTKSKSSIASCQKLRYSSSPQDKAKDANSRLYKTNMATTQAFKTTIDESKIVFDPDSKLNSLSTEPIETPKPEGVLSSVDFAYATSRTVSMGYEKDNGTRERPLPLDTQLQRKVLDSLNLRAVLKEKDFHIRKGIRLRDKEHIEKVVRFQKQLFGLADQISLAYRFNFGYDINDPEQLDDLQKFLAKNSYSIYPKRTNKNKK